MKKFILFSFLLPALGAIGFFSCRHPQPIPEKIIAETLLQQVDSFSASCRLFQEAVENKISTEGQLHQLFLKSRLQYKEMEWACEYFVPATARLVNGPPVPEIEMPDRMLKNPAGLQVMEGLLFPSYDTTNKNELLRQSRMLQTACERYSSYFKNIGIFNWQVFDAVKLEIFRIMTLGITGFDNPQTLQSMTESAAAMGSLQRILDLYQTSENAGALHEDIRLAIKYLTDHPEFNSFNRMEFIKSYGNPVTDAIAALQEKLKFKVIRYNRLLNQDARTLFDTNTFNVNAFAPDNSSFLTEEKVALGKKLFSDPLLSGTGNRSCRSCHQPEKAFTDGLVKNTVIGEKVLLSRNTPTLLNAALQSALFYDMRVNSLEAQSHSVVQSEKEMHGSMQLSVQKLWKDTVYRSLFKKAFPKEDPSRIDTFEVMNALGSYIRSLVLLNSRFDEFMRGNLSAMQADEINGFNLFMGKAKCATCHYMPLFNGVFPPAYKRTEVEVIGVPVSRTKNEIDPDMGRYGILPFEPVKHAFKIPTVRNAALTAPYMHNGVFESLEQLMDFYNKGGGAGLGIKVPNQTLPTDKLNLTDKEISDVIAFIKTLDSKPSP